MARRLAKEEGILVGIYLGCRGMGLRSSLPSMPESAGKLVVVILPEHGGALPQHLALRGRLRHVPADVDTGPLWAQAHGGPRHALRQREQPPQIDCGGRRDISEKYLGQIIIPLKSAGLVISHRGAHGGYSLARPPEDITVKDVVEAIEGTIAPVPCVDPVAGASVGECGENPVRMRARHDLRGHSRLAQAARRYRLLPRFFH